MGNIGISLRRIFDFESIMKKHPVTICLILLLAGCMSSAPVPVINKSPLRNIPEAYEVRQGDSIYKIAWAFGVDFLDIAKFSNLKKPYKLTPGQVVYLQKREVKVIALGSDDLSSNELSEPAIAKELPVKKPRARPSTQAKAVPSVSFSSSPKKWNWPAEGKLVGNYSLKQGSKGIQISGVDGSPVKATAAGDVVYAGEGLRGYGKLIILKHSADFLSAYAHNKKILVKEGQTIQSGQQIATMGSSGAQSTMLHFEIRKGGKPVNPMRYLK